MLSEVHASLRRGHHVLDMLERFLREEYDWLPPKLRRRIAKRHAEMFLMWFGEAAAEVRSQARYRSAAEVAEAAGHLTAILDQWEAVRVGHRPEIIHIERLWSWLRDGKVVELRRAQ